MKVGSVFFTFIEPKEQEKIAEKLPKVLETLSNLGYVGVEGLPRDFIHMLSGKKLELITPPISKMGFPEQSEIQEVAKFASTLGVRIVVVGPSSAHARDVWHHGYTEKSLKDDIARFSDMGKICRDYNMDLCIHLEGKAIQSLNKVLELTDPEYVNLCLDTGWMMAGLRDPMKVTAKHADRIKHVHLKDWRKTSFNIGLDAPLLGEFCELGTGEIDFSQVFDVLKESGYNGWCVVEIPIYHNRNVSQAPAPEESARINIQYLRKFI